MSEKYEELARSARCLAGSTATPNWNAAKALFQATCTPYKIMEITEDLDRVTAERDAGLAREAALAQNLKYAEEGYLSIAESADASAQTLHEVITRLKAERDALQVLLTAADDLNDTAKSERDAALAKLNKALELLRGTHTGDLFGPDDWETIDAFLSATTMTEADDEK